MVIPLCVQVIRFSPSVCTKGYFSQLQECLFYVQEHHRTSSHLHILQRFGQAATHCLLIMAVAFLWICIPQRQAVLLKKQTVLSGAKSHRCPQ